jgi:hypothetical protein
VRDGGFRLIVLEATRAPLLYCESCSGLEARDGTIEQDPVLSERITERVPGPAGAYDAVAGIPAHV